jgi:uncharacterized protein YlxP (DUF503 family)
MAIGQLFLKVEIPSCISLKEKRSTLRHLIHRMQREFNIYVCEFDLQNMKTMTVIGCAMINSNHVSIEQVFAQVSRFIEKSFPRLQIHEYSTEYL